MPRKRKAHQSDHHDPPTLKEAGRPKREYGIEDAVKLVSLMLLTLFEVDMVSRVLI
jgi:hypothetical protein